MRAQWSCRQDQKPSPRLPALLVPHHEVPHKAILKGAPIQHPLVSTGSLSRSRKEQIQRERQRLVEMEQPERESLQAGGCVSPHGTNAGLPGGRTDRGWGVDEGGSLQRHSAPVGLTCSQVPAARTGAKGGRWQVMTPNHVGPGPHSGSAPSPQHDRRQALASQELRPYLSNE